MKPNPPEFQRVLVVKLSALGDVLHALPVVSYLRQAAPSVEIHWVVDASFADLLDTIPGIDKVVRLPIRKWKGKAVRPGTWREAFAAVGALRRGRYDAAFDLQGNLKSGIVTWLSGARLRFGFDREGVREVPNLLFTNRKARSLPNDRHVSEKYLRLASEPFGLPFDRTAMLPCLPILPDDRAAARLLVRDLLHDAAPQMVLHPGSTWPTKRMTSAFWAEVVRRLRERHPRLGVLISWGNEEEKEEAERIRASARGPVALLPRLSLNALAAVFRECRFVIAPDTGPLHVAAAAGASTVSVFRATDGRRNAPQGPDHRFVQAPLPCTACLRRQCERDAECRESVRPGAVASLMAGLMSVSVTANHRPGSDSR